MKKSLSLVALMLVLGNTVSADKEIPNPTMPADMGPMDFMPLPMPQVPLPTAVVTMNLGTATILQKEGTYVLKIDVPGISKSDIKVYIQDGMLVVEAKQNEENLKKEEKEIENGKVILIANERQMTSFARTFTLPQDVVPDSKKVQAKLDDGVLVINLPRLPKKIEEVKVL